MKIYTKTGDKGTTALFGGTRVPKHHIRIECYGTVDELNSYIGLIRDQEIDEHKKKVLLQIQNNLFIAGSILATDPDKAILKSGKELLKIEKIKEEDVNMLENEIDKMNKFLPQMTHFILPGGHTTVSYCHISRCVCRRAERLASHLNEIEPINELVLMYLNRLSDYLFVLARMLTQELQIEEIKWTPKRK